MTVEGGEGHLVEVDKPYIGYARAGEGGCAMGAYAATANYYDEGRAEVLETFVSEEDAVACELFEDKLCRELVCRF